MKAAPAARLTESYVRGASVPALIQDPIGHVFDRTALRHADREALVVCDQGVRWTWAELQRRVEATAAGLLRLGLEPGDRIGIWAPNCAEWVVIQFAAAKAGLILVNLNPAYRVAELEYALVKAGCKALVTAAAFKTSDYVAMLHELLPELGSAPPGALRATRAPALRTVVYLAREPIAGMLPFEEVGRTAGPSDRARLRAIAGTLRARDPIDIQFTSGTTGAPKGATLSHFGMLNNAFMIGEPMRLRAADRLCIQVPLYHAFGTIMATLACAVRGATMVLPGRAFDPLASLQAIERERCTAVHGVPTMFIALLDQPEFARFDTRSLRTGIMAGSPCPVELMKRVIGELHVPEITIGYGMTETSALSFQTRPDDRIERRVGSVGTIHPHVEARIVDERGEVVPPGTPGEILTRGYGVMLGYWEDPERTREAVDAEGWMHTGDLGTLDEDGYCNVVGRLKDMVIRGGENLFPREIEEFLHGHPRVREVQVFGVPDPKYGEELCAWIRLSPGPAVSEGEIRDFCRDRIAHFKIPRYVCFVDEFPVTVTGKVQKFVMRRKMIETLGLREEPEIPGGLHSSVRQ